MGYAAALKVAEPRQVLDNRATLANNAMVLLPRPRQKSVPGDDLRGKFAPMRCQGRRAWRDERVRFGPPHCTLSNLLTKPEIDAIGSLHRNIELCIAKRIRGETDTTASCPHSEAGQDFSIWIGRNPLKSPDSKK